MYSGSERRKKIQNTHAIVDMAVKKVLPEAFLMMGIDIKHPLETQKDMAFLRGSRKCFKGVLATILASVTGWLVYLFRGDHS